MLEGRRPVYHVQTARLSHATQPASVAPEVRLRTSLDDPDDAAIAGFEAMMRRLDTFNRDVAAGVESTGCRQASLRLIELTKTTLRRC